MAPKTQRVSLLRNAGASAVAPNNSSRCRSLSQRRSTGKAGSAGKPGSARGRSSNSSIPATSAASVDDPHARPESVKVLDLVQSSASTASTSVTATFGDENISSDELLEIRTLKRPPRVVQRALEATYMLLMAAELPRPFAPPDWSSVQRLLADACLLTRMLSYDIGILRTVPELLSFLKSEYFGGAADAKDAASHDARSLVSKDEESLTFERVLRASHAAAALFRWCSITVTAAAEAACAETPAVEEEQAPEPPKPPPLDLSTVEVPEQPVEETPQRQLRADRHFEALVPSLPFAISTSISLPVIVEIMNARPDLTLELMVTVDPIEGAHRAKERLQNVQEYFSSKGVTCVVKKGLQKVSPEGEAGVNCILHLDNDADLVRFFRNKRFQDKSPRMMDEAPQYKPLRDVVEKLEEWFQIQMHF